MSNENIQDNIRRIMDNAASAAVRSGRKPEDVKVVAVSKTVTADMIEKAAAFGLRDFGENRVQEALKKIDVLPQNIQWHLVGHLQTNKVKQAAGRFCLIHSVDSLRLARTIEQESLKQGVTAPVLVQVNVSGEESKFGISPDELPDFLNQVSAMQALEVRGLMTVAPIVKDAELARPYFRLLKQLADKNSCPGISLSELSMGMSGDYLTAIEEGATIVRIGRAIFGDRR